MPGCQGPLPKGAVRSISTMKLAEGLRAALRRHGHDARWVFGVRTWPFRAHCWLQRGEVVLDDDLETLVPLTPILVI